MEPTLRLLFKEEGKRNNALSFVSSRYLFRSPASSAGLAPLATAESLNQFFAGENNEEINQFIDRMSNMG